MYDWTKWLDHVTTPANTYKIKNGATGETFIATITLDGEIMQQGTPQDQAHFNNIEGGIFDAHAALALLINTVRQSGWDIEAIGDAVSEQTGEVTLINSLEFPFNNSERTIALPAARSNANYDVRVEIVSASGNAGEIIVSNKLTNGFKLAYTGSASSVTIKYAVGGGYSK